MSGKYELGADMRANIRLILTLVVIVTTLLIFTAWADARRGQRAKRTEDLSTELASCLVKLGGRND